MRPHPLRTTSDGEIQPVGLATPMAIYNEQNELHQGPERLGSSTQPSTLPHTMYINI